MQRLFSLFLSFGPRVFRNSLPHPSPHQKVCVLFHVSAMSYCLPPEVKEFLTSPDISLVGLGRRGVGKGFGRQGLGAGAGFEDLGFGAGAG